MVKAKEKIAEGTKKRVKAVESALDSVSSDKINNAESKVHTELEEIPEQAKIQYRDYYLDSADAIESKLSSQNTDNISQIDKTLSKIESVAFKYHYHGLSKSYYAQFPLIKIDGETIEVGSDTEKKTKDLYRIRVDKPEKCMRGFLVKKIVFDQNELQTDKLNNVYSSISEAGSVLAMLIHRTHSDCYLTFLIKSGDTDDQATVADNTIETLRDVFIGNFPGSKTGNISGGYGMPSIYKSIEEISAGDLSDSIRAIDGLGAYHRESEYPEYSVPDLFDEIFTVDKCQAISAFIGVPSLKSEDSKYINQGIEKLIDGVVPEEGEAYTLLLLADPLSPDRISEIRGGYEDLATIISPFQGFQYNQTYVEAQTLSNQFSDNLSDQVTLSSNYAVGMGAHADANASANVSTSKGISAPVDGDAGKTSGANAGGSVGLSVHADIAHNVASGRSYASTVGYGYTENKGRNDGTTYQFTSSRVTNIFNRLNKEIERINDGEGAGLWSFAGFAIASDRALSQRVASIYQGLIQGETSSVERNSVNTWNQGDEDFNAILTSVLNLRLPSFVLKNKESNYPEKIVYSTEVNSAELSMLLNLPQKAVPGLPVITCAPFGRNVCTLDGKMQDSSDAIRLGNLYHMSHVDFSCPVNINKEKFTSHLFVTGSTGTGKSNTVYKLLEEIAEPKKINDKLEATSKTRFMVIEPTKGEYRNVIGGWDNVNVYSTNPKMASLLVINPFEFPTESIHVLEHIERLVEIFNACWPMYAAMPAILKEAIEETYRAVGWDIDESYSATSRFPSFWDLLQVLPKVVKKSHYSDDTSSDYIGALVTRVNSLTTGLNGKIFNTVNSLTNEMLFEKNTVIDLSLVGSPETKALIMGILVLKLQEYHMNRRLISDEIIDNEALNHLTILEEAHLLLRKSSFEQSQEGANLQGKSVEMLSNAIAEMRTYGEGFIIVDQAPDLLDPAVIRNTNTKIVMRLPDQKDRTLMGGALALNEDQINELAKIPNWVGAVYQSDWLEPVLCQVDEFTKDYKKPYKKGDNSNEASSVLGNFLRDILTANENRELNDQNKAEILKAIESHSMLAEADDIILGKIFTNREITPEECKTLVYDIIGGSQFVAALYPLLDDASGESSYEYLKIVNQINRQFGINNMETSAQLLEYCFDVARAVIPTDDEEKRLLDEKAELLVQYREVSSWHLLM